MYSFIKGFFVIGLKGFDVFVGSKLLVVIVPLLAKIEASVVFVNDAVDEIFS